MEPGSETGGQLSASEIHDLKREEIDRQLAEIKFLSPEDQLRAVESKRQVLNNLGMDADNWPPEKVISEYVNHESKGIE